jgi:hypothetical protein
VAGGANFGPADAADLWELPKRYLADAFELTRGESGRLRWQEGFRLQSPRAYRASATSEKGLVCLGGQNDNDVSTAALLLT